MIAENAGIRDLIVLERIGPLNHFIEVDVTEGQTVGSGLDLRASASLPAWGVEFNPVYGGDLKCRFVRG